MEQAVATLSQENQSDHSLVKPVTITDVVLLSPGIWKGPDMQETKYTPEGIRNGFLNTNWEDMNLFLDHKDAEGPAAAYWIGFIRNVNMVGEELHGDLEIWHPLFTMFIKKAKVQFGVSMLMRGNEDFNNGEDYSDYDIKVYTSGSLVDDPGCKDSWLPKMLSAGIKDTKKVIGGNVSLEKIKALSNSKIHSSKKGLASNDVDVSESPDSEKISDEEDKCKEVKKMTDEVNQEKSKEETTEEATEESTEEKSEEATEEAKSESSTEAEDNDVKQLSAAIEKNSIALANLTKLVQKSLAAGDKTEEETKEVTEEKSEEATEEETTEKSKDDELESTKSKLEETEKQLAAAKAELDNAPDEKSLAAGSNSAPVDANAGMLGFLRKNAHLE